MRDSGAAIRWDYNEAQFTISSDEVRVWSLASINYWLHDLVINQSITKLQLLDCELVKMR